MRISEIERKDAYSKALNRPKTDKETGSSSGLQSLKQGKQQVDRITGAVSRAWDRFSKHPLVKAK